MKKRLIIFLLLILVAVGGYVGWRYFQDRQGAPPTPGSTLTPSTQNPAVATQAVTIHNYAFSPQNITVKKNSTVTWTNQDLVGYTVTGDIGKTSPASQVIPQNQTYSFKFTALGLFRYHNSLDPNMVGTVTVTE